MIYVVLRVEHIPPVAPRLGLAMFASPSRDCVKERYVKRCARQTRSCCGSSEGDSVVGRVENL